jgi:hypothetical protein
MASIRNLYFMSYLDVHNKVSILGLYQLFNKLFYTITLLLKNCLIVLSELSFKVYIN